MKYRATEIYGAIHYQRCRNEKEDESSHGNHTHLCNRCRHDEELSYEEDCLLKILDLSCFLKKCFLFFKK